MALSSWLGHALIGSFRGFPELAAEGHARKLSRQEYVLLVQTVEQSMIVTYTLLLPDERRAEAWCFQTQD